MKRLNWTSRGDISEYWLSGIAFGNNKFVAVGGFDGKVLKIGKMGFVKIVFNGIIFLKVK